MPDTYFYRYDDFDRTLLQERIGQFRDQVRRRLAGELTEEQFKPLRLQNGLYLQLHAYMLRIAIPYGDPVDAPIAQAGRDLAHLRSRLRPFHDASEPAAQLDQARGRARRRGGAGRSRYARDPDQRQRDPQHHRRPLRRRRGRRDRGSARLVRDDSAVVDAPPRVQLPAAQVQDRRDRFAQRSRRRAGARRRPAAVAQSRGRSRLRGDHRRRPRPHPDHRQDDPRIPAQGRAARLSRIGFARLQIVTAGATTSTRRASRSWCTRSASRRCARKSRPNLRRPKTAP